MNPKNIHCLALNYLGVGPQTTQKPLYFIKASNAYACSGAEVEIPKDVASIWTEVELGIVIAEDVYNIPVDAVEDVIGGFVVCADITCSNIEDRDHHLAFSKSRPGFCPVSEASASLSRDAIRNLDLVTEINGLCTQKGNTGKMVLDAFECVAYLSSITKLEKDDLILTGTPPGHENNMLKQGDDVRHIIQHVGELRYSIV